MKKIAKAIMQALFNCFAGKYCGFSL